VFSFAISYFQFISSQQPMWDFSDSLPTTWIYIGIFVRSGVKCNRGESLGGKNQFAGHGGGAAHAKNAKVAKGGQNNLSFTA
jgi:hypothetical protein